MGVRGCSYDQVTGCHDDAITVTSGSVMTGTLQPCHRAGCVHNQMLECTGNVLVRDVADCPAYAVL